ncbi:hypothetical protein [Streptomyces sp. NRRL S-337]|uniref:hypothetical protein n=1 Tax=Streptomyces sp. NRRL S-337 TaxID=1463900 RepID=UPI0004C850B7|nr:hypothetical protein [Streptomyces sp. NRRL S-337]
MTTLSTVAACSTGAGNLFQDNQPSAIKSTASAVLTLGQSSQEQEITKYNKTGRFTITPTKVVEGKPKDLKELNDSKFDGQKIAWVYVRAKHVGGSAVKEPEPMVNIGAETTDGSPATRFLLIADLTAMPKDCKRFDAVKDIEDEDLWQRGEERTMCEPYLIPANAKIKYVTYSQGFYDQPLRWSVK